MGEYWESLWNLYAVNDIIRIDFNSCYLVFCLCFIGVTIFESKNLLPLIQMRYIASVHLHVFQLKTYSYHSLADILCWVFSQHNSNERKKCKDKKRKRWQERNIKNAEQKMIGSFTIVIKCLSTINWIIKR